jgi:hypothetical protein
VLTTENAAGTNCLTCLPKHGGARDNNFLVAYDANDQRCFTFESVLTAQPSSSYCNVYCIVIIIIIISPLQSTAGHRPLQLLAISLDLRLLYIVYCRINIMYNLNTYCSTKLICNVQIGMANSLAGLSGIRGPSDTTINLPRIPNTRSTNENRHLMHNLITKSFVTSWRHESDHYLHTIWDNQHPH